MPHLRLEVKWLVIFFGARSGQRLLVGLGAGALVFGIIATLHLFAGTLGFFVASTFLACFASKESRGGDNGNDGECDEDFLHRMIFCLDEAR
jgi:hypothetical protein